MYSRTVGNCKPAPASKAPKPATAGASPPDDVEMAGGDAVAENEGEGIATKPVFLQEDGQPIRELVDTPKPKKRALSGLGKEMKSQPRC